MVFLKRLAHCVSTEPQAIIDVPSQTQSNVIYEVRIPLPEDPPEEYICNCKGFFYNRGRCVHQMMAYAGRCLWTEAEGPEHLRQGQDYCPRCGGEINYATEIDEQKTDQSD